MKRTQPKRPRLSPVSVGLRRLWTGHALVVGCAALVAAGLVYPLLGFKQDLATLSAAVITAALGAGATLVLDYLLVIRPIQRLSARDSDPVAPSKPMKQPFIGLDVVLALVRTIEDYRLQREAFTRLVEAYRSLAQLDRHRMSLKTLLAVPFQSGLSQQISVFRVNLQDNSAEPLGPAPAQMDREHQARLVENLASENLEFAADGLLWMASPYHDMFRGFLVLRIEPRQLWNRFPKVYRRFFSLLIGLLHDSLGVETDKDSTSRGARSEAAQPASRQSGTRGAQRETSPRLEGVDMPPSSTLPVGTQGRTSDSLSMRLHLVKDDYPLGEPQALAPHCGLALRPGMRCNGDFLCVYRNTRTHTDLVIQGTAVGPSSLVSEAAAYLTGWLSSQAISKRLALVAEALHTLQPRGGAPESVIQGVYRQNPKAEPSAQGSKDTITVFFRDVAKALHDHLQLVFSGTLGVQATIMLFGHERGTGTFVSFGAAPPYLSSPDERKPLQLAATHGARGMLGLAVLPDIHPAPFDAIAGQVVVLCSAGVLNLKDEKGRTFEREIQRGRLLAIEPEIRREGATLLANAILDQAEQHNSHSFLTDAASVVCLAADGTFASQGASSLGIR